MILINGRDEEALVFTNMKKSYYRHIFLALVLLEMGGVLILTNKAKQGVVSNDLLLLLFWASMALISILAFAFGNIIEQSVWSELIKKSENPRLFCVSQVFALLFSIVCFYIFLSDFIKYI